MRQTYQVKDLYLAAFLRVQGRILIRTIREQTVCWFVFQGKTGCEELANQYWSDTALVKVKSYVDSIQTMKDLIYARR